MNDKPGPGRPPYFTEAQWQEHLRANGRTDEIKGAAGGKREKPSWLSAEEWADHLRAQPGPDEKVVQFDKTRKRKPKPPPTRRQAAGPLSSSDSAATTAAE
jgi:hypothetical protein